MNWKYVAWSATIASSVFDMYVKYRQWRLLNKERILEHDDNRIRSQAFQKNNMVLGIVQKSTELLINSLLICFNLHHKIWTATSSTNNRLLRQLMFLGITELIRALVQSSFEFYRKFVIEQASGVNKLTRTKFIVEQVLSVSFSTLFSLLVYAGLISIIERFGDTFPMVGSFFFMSAIVFFMSISPNIFWPMFYKFSPVPEGGLRNALQHLLEPRGFPTEQVFMVNESDKTTHSGAVIVGFSWNKSIVVYDSLVHKCSTKEVLAVICHEVGHWERSHLPKQLLNQGAQIFIDFQLFVYLYQSPQFYSAFGFSDMPIAFGLVAFSILTEPIQIVFNIQKNYVSRICERQADIFAATLGFKDELKSALFKVKRDTLRLVNTDWLYNLYSETHPTLQERQANLDSFSAVEVH
ncbi:CAAX prenyl protease 1 [[Candida] jaroonii]|uniref:CAAX prenyl protease 1 n=1 Tax=[Candida] jaroonii TaxID=467808 RepID=A0ACA9Y5P9_9ASCO|nr:CAAX prenyl protease 1 [[Candida] jaroonii]